MKDIEMRYRSRKVANCKLKTVLTKYYNYVKIEKLKGIGFKTDYCNVFEEL